MKSAATFLAIVVAIGLAIFFMMLLGQPADAPPEEDGSASPSAESEPAATAEAMPDLVIDDVGWPGGLVPPGPVEISATVRNQGSAAYGNAIVVEVPGGGSGVISGGLGVGESQSVVIDVLAVSPGVTYTLQLMVDPDDVIPELDESNNVSGEISFATAP